MISAVASPLKGWLVAGAAVALAASGFAAGWTAQGWRKTAEVSTSKVECAQVKESTATATTVSVQGARTKEQALNNNQTKASDELQKALDVSRGRAAALEQRLRQLASDNPRPSCPIVPEGAGAASEGDGVPAAGLSDVARADLVRLAQSANETGDTLISCRILLREAWRQTQ